MGRLDPFIRFPSFRRQCVLRTRPALLRKYRKVPMTLTDVCLVGLADQMDSGQILTLDRDFETYRWRSRWKFELLIEL